MTSFILTLLLTVALSCVSVDSRRIGSGIHYKEADPAPPPDAVQDVASHSSGAHQSVDNYRLGSGVHYNGVAAAYDPPSPAPQDASAQPDLQLPVPMNGGGGISTDPQTSPTDTNPMHAPPASTMAAKVDLKPYDEFPTDVPWPSVAEITYIQRLLAFYTTAVSFDKASGVVVIDLSKAVDSQGDVYENALQRMEAMNSMRDMLSALIGAGLQPLDQAIQLGSYIDVKATKVELAYPDMPDSWERKKQIFTLMKKTHEREVGLLAALLMQKTGVML